MNVNPVASGLPVVAAESRTERLTSLFDAHYDRLYRLARRLVPTTDDALDLVQETFLKAANSPKSVPSGSTTEEEAWLVRVLIRSPIGSFAVINGNYLKEQAERIVNGIGAN